MGSEVAPAERADEIRDWTPTRTPRLLILAGVLLGLQAPLFLYLAGTFVVLDFMTWGLEDHSPGEDVNREFNSMAAFAIAVLLSSVLIPLATYVFDDGGHQH